MLIQVGAGFLLAAVAVPLWLRRVPPNGIYGFRVPKTRSDPVVWFDANAYAGRQLLVFGLGYATFGALLAGWPGIGPDAYAWSCLAVVAVGLVAVVVRCFRYLGRIS
jgi:uncharacterized membrane protein